MNESSLFFVAEENIRWETTRGRVLNSGQSRAVSCAYEYNKERKFSVSRREEYEQKTEKLLEPVVGELGFELVDVEYVKEGGTWYLRAYIDKPGGITVDDCRAVSRRFSDILDEKDYIEDSYVSRSVRPPRETAEEGEGLRSEALGKKWRYAHTARSTDRRSS